MDAEEVIRAELLALLNGGNAHMDLAEAVADFPMDQINTIFPNGTYSAWHLLEHITRTQFDILDFIANPKYEERSWPQDYWPNENQKATVKDWDKTLAKYRKDLEGLKKIVKSKKTDLYTKIAWGDGQNILREILVVSDHTAYHLGEFAIMRQVMSTWGGNHR